MHTVRKDTTFVGISELRAKWSQVQEAMKTNHVVVGRRHIPAAVLLPLKQFEEMEEALDRLEDYALALKAYAREQGSKPEDYIALEDVLKRLSKMP